VAKVKNSIIRVSSLSEFDGSRYLGWPRIILNYAGNACDAGDVVVRPRR